MREKHRSENHDPDELRSLGEAVFRYGGRLCNIVEVGGVILNDRGVRQEARQGGVIRGGVRIGVGVNGVFRSVCSTP